METRRSAIDAAVGGALGDIAKREAFEGKASQVITLHTHGKIPGDVTNPHIRDISASVAQAANKLGCNSVDLARSARSPVCGLLPGSRARFLGDRRSPDRGVTGPIEMSIMMSI